MPEFIARHRINETGLEKIIDTVNQEINEYGVSTVEIFYDHKIEELCCILEAPDENTIRNYYANVGLVCGYIAPIQKIRTKSMEKSDKLKTIGELAARLAHDLRNPLSVIKNTIEIMEGKQRLQLEEKVIYYGRLNRAIDRISHQIEDVLDFVRPTTLHFDKYLLNEIIASTLEKIVKPDAVTINIPKNFVYCVCDSTKIEVVLTNLLVNAIQSMDNRGQIDIKLFDAKNDIMIQVSDTGCGIPEEMVSKVFDPLFTTKQTGTGLGLASCKKIIAQHNGMIKVASELKKGTTFTIILPKNKIRVSQKIPQK